VEHGSCRRLAATRNPRGELEVVRFMQAAGWTQANRSFMSGASRLAATLLVAQPATALK
jgi:hypothetical protein